MAKKDTKQEGTVQTEGNDRIARVESDIEGLKDAINSLARSVTGAIEGLKAQKEAPTPATLRQTPQPGQVFSATPVVSAQIPTQNYVPPEWRQVVHDILNQKFDVSVEYRTDGQFELVVRVPKEYSNATAEHWNTYKEDRRVKVINNALGTVGVKEYVELISQNLGQEMRTRIAMDRVMV